MIDGQQHAPGQGPATGASLVAAGRTVLPVRARHGEIGPHGGGSPDDLNAAGNVIREYHRILIKRKWLILSCALGVLALGAVRTMLLTPLYSSTLRLQIDRNVSKVVESGNITPVEGADNEFLRTQYELLQSRAMAERVASALKLGEDPTFTKPREFSVLGKLMNLFASLPPAGETVAQALAREQAAAAIILLNRSVKPVPGSRLVDIAVTDPVPYRAQLIAKAYADAFIASNFDKRLEANVYAKTFLEDQVKQLKRRLADSEKILIGFAQKQQIVVVNDKSSIAENNLSAANAALGNLISDRIKNEQQWRQVEKADAINLPQLLTNSVIDGLRGKRNELTTEYQEKLQTFKAGYPLMVQLKNKIAEIDRQLASEVRTIKASLKGAFESASQQEAEMNQRIVTLNGEVLDLQQRSIQYNILKREVDTNRSLYEGLLQRYKEVDVAGGVGANNVFVVDRAQLPSSPSSPQLMRELLLALALGLGLGLGAAFLIEQLDDSVHSSEEIERLTGLATLGIIPKVGARKTMQGEVDNPNSAISEGYRSFCTSLQFSTDRGLPSTLLFTSSKPAEGKSTSSMIVARHFARLGLRVLLLDADLRNSSLYRKLNLQNHIGLSTFLGGACTPTEALQRTDTANLAFMAAGPTPPNAADLLASPQLTSLLTFGLEVFDLIVIDGPPVLGIADVALLSNAAAATVFVIGAGEARMGPVRGALKRLRMSRAPVIGMLMTKFDARNAGDGYGYGYFGAVDGFGYQPARAPGNRRQLVRSRERA